MPPVFRLQQYQYSADQLSEEEMVSNSFCPSSTVQIFVGAPIQNKSEYDCLRAFYDLLTQKNEWAYIFSNFHAGGRQIDLAIFTEKSSLVIEAKGYRLPLKGNINGLWEQIGPYGSRKIGNAYNQALDAKNVLRDEIQRFANIAGYPNGAVIITPRIPDGSNLTAGGACT